VSETHTIQEVVANKELLRELAFPLLGECTCAGCCSVPDIAEALAKKLQQHEWARVRYICEKGYGIHTAGEMFDRWVRCMTPAEKVACLLAAMLPEKVKVSE
jgi:hypothetical protein